MIRSIENQLLNVYSNLKNEISNLDENLKKQLEGPDLINVSKEYIESKPKIMIIGQENCGWGYSCYEFQDTWTLQDALAVYKN